MGDRAGMKGASDKVSPLSLGMLSLHLAWRRALGSIGPTALEEGGGFGKLLIFGVGVIIFGLFLRADRSEGTTRDGVDRNRFVCKKGELPDAGNRSTKRAGVMGGKSQNRE